MIFAEFGGGGLWVFVVVPAVIALVALAGGLKILSVRHDENGDTNPWRVIGSVLLLSVALGIGGCYAVVFLGGAFGN